MKIKYLASFLLLMTGVLCQAQSIRYVSYFPVPFASHEKISVKTLSILGSQDDADINIGSTSNISGTFVVNSGFYAAGDVSVNTENPSMPASGFQLVAGSSTSLPATPAYNGSLSSLGQITVASSVSGITALTADNTATIQGVYWGSNGGIGLNGSGNINWPSKCSGKDLVWAHLKVAGSDSYRTYLTCGSGAASGGGTSGCTGVCSAGQTASCGGGNGVKTCSSTCSWGSCVCNSGYNWSGSTCIAQAAQNCSNVNYKINHKSECCPSISIEEDDGTCYTRTWVHYGGQSIGYGGCYAPEDGTQSCMADTSKRYSCIEDTDQYIPCVNDGDICACMGCGNVGLDTFINTVNYKCSITNNGW